MKLTQEQKNEKIIIKALQILETKLTYGSIALSDPSVVKDYLRLKLADKQSEVFSALYLDSAHQLIKYSELFQGSIASATVYPREVIKEALDCNAASIIFAHNHPSGNPEPSQQDRRITDKLKSALSFIDIQVLDHIVVGKTVTSFAEQGLI